MNEPSKTNVRTESDMHSLPNYLLHGIYYLLYGFVKYLAFPLCDYLRFFVIRLFSSHIHATYIRDGVSIAFPWRVKIGRNSSLNQGVLIDGYGSVVIGDNVRIGAYTAINTSDHQYKNPDQPILKQGFVVGSVIIEDDVWIGRSVNINKGVTIGKGSVVGAGSVVTKDIPPFSVAVGVPCKVIKSRK